jgi:dephospho-CoA kinase
MGFSWNPKEESWEAMRKQLVKYCDQYGDCKVPKKWPDNRALGHWVGTQRKEKKKLDQGLHARITKERIMALESMGFVWKIRS